MPLTMLRTIGEVKEACERAAEMLSDLYRPTADDIAAVTFPDVPDDWRDYLCGVSSEGMIDSTAAREIDMAIRFLIAAYDCARHWQPDSDGTFEQMRTQGLERHTFLIGTQYTLDRLDAIRNMLP